MYNFNMNFKSMCKASWKNEVIKIEEDNYIKEDINIWLLILSIVVPFAGVIIFFYLRRQKPRVAKICGICSLINYIIITISIPIVLFSSKPAKSKDKSDESIINTNETKTENSLSNSVSNETNTVDMTDDIQNKTNELNITNSLYEAEEKVNSYMAIAVAGYYEEKNLQNGDSKTSFTKYVKNALKKAKKELKEKGVELTASGKTIYLLTETKKTSGNITKDGKVEWSKVENK